MAVHVYSHLEHALLIQCINMSKTIECIDRSHCAILLEHFTVKVKEATALLLISWS